MTIYIGDSLTWLKKLPSESVNCIVTSPPYYGKRDYGVDGQIGLEETPEMFIEKLMLVFREAWRVLKSDGTCWINLGDSYWQNRSEGNGRTGGTGGTALPGREHQARAGGKSHSVYKPKDLMFIPHRVAMALQIDGWYIRNSIVWHKPAPMPESVKDRCTSSHEYIFLCTKSEHYYFNADAIRENAAPDDNRIRQFRDGDESTLRKDNGNGYQSSGTRNKRDVWTINTEASGVAHFATMPSELAENCIKAGCPENGMVLDPFGGAGTTALAAIHLNRQYQLIELNIKYVGIAQQRIAAFNPMQDTTLPDGTKQLSLLALLEQTA